MTKQLLVLAIFLLLSTLGVAQPNEGVEMAEGMRSSGKIWVVIAVLLVIFTGIVIFLIFLERKVKKLEQHNNK